MSATSTGQQVQHLRLSELLSRAVIAHDGQRLGRARDAIVRLDMQPGHHPPLVGLVVSVGHRDLFVPGSFVADLAGDSVTLTTARLDLRPFERRAGEVLLKHDLLGHRLIDVPAARLVRARDLELSRLESGWVLVGVDVAPRRRLERLLHRKGFQTCLDWSEFEPLIGHDATVNCVRRSRGCAGCGRPRLPISWRRRPATRARRSSKRSPDDKELEADVIEELEPESQVHVLAERSDAEVADVLAHMRPDDAADVLAEFPQERRLPVLELLPLVVRTKIRVLLGVNPGTAGGLMTPEFVSVPSDVSVEAALATVGAAGAISTEVLYAIYVVDGRRLVGAVSLPALVQAEAAATVGDIAERDPVRLAVDADITEVAVRMTDFNLVTMPVVNDEDELLGVITVDDVLEASVPEDWWDRVEDVEEAPRSRRRSAGQAVAGADRRSP